MTRYRPHIASLPVLAGLSLAALAGAALAEPGTAPHKPQPTPRPVVRITCPTVAPAPAVPDSAPADAQCPWQYRMGVRRPLWP